QDQLVCYPDGRIEVTVVTPISTLADYTFRWYRDTYTPGQELVDDNSDMITAAVLDTANYATLGEGTYYVTTVKNSGNAPGSGCESPPFRINIQDKHLDPIAQLTATPNIACVDSLSNGTVVAVVREADGDTTDVYQYDWTMDGGALPNYVVQTDDANTSSLTNAKDGDYILTVTNVSETGCVFTQGITVKLDQPKAEPNIIDVFTVDPIDCNPSARAQVTSISIGGGAPVTDSLTLLTDYTYAWYYSDVKPETLMRDSLGNAVTTSNLDNIIAGSYFVFVTSLSTGCESLPKEVVINDTDIIYPKVVINETIPQISCSDPYVGVLEATGDGFTDVTNPIYQFTWYNTLDLTGPVISTTYTAGGLGKGDYSVEVLNTVTGCTASALYIMEDRSMEFYPIIVTTQDHNQNCVNPDGSAIGNFLTIQDYPFPYDYTFDWWDGLNPNYNAAPDYANQPTVTGLSAGYYSVRVTDNNTQCVSYNEVEVLENIIFPEVVVTLDNPLVNCDPARPNGQISVEMDGGRPLKDYTVTWHAGTDATGTVLSVTDKLIGVGMGLYTVSVTNNITGCVITETKEVTDGRYYPPAPDPVVINHRTHCIDPDGIIDVTVGGETLNYSFTWYAGSSTNDPELSVYPRVFDLDIGSYAVTATDLTTGCVSEAAVIEVLDMRELPIMEYDIGPSMCEYKTGFVRAKIKNEASVTAQSIEWEYLGDRTDMTETYHMGGQWYEIADGEYQVTITTTMGCVLTETVEIGTVITGYQGVSPNGDGENDFFTIDCIARFPDNNVKIFNRAGVLVYEASGYDNAHEIFDGTGKNGIYFTGDQVPDGTYFFIIDKMDGTKPTYGYLELLR
ncbi:MAG: gliding motility-associated C-terminal domain-containing protein, partial [Cyclobacteriaceae bacterium]|nr:gliding motility-associated C-terminal domain-containing protein [Cyclobacteriaceae bacterium]